MFHGFYTHENWDLNQQLLYIHGLVPTIQRYGGVHKVGIPKKVGSSWKILSKWMISGYHHFRKPPYVCIETHGDLGYNISGHLHMEMGGTEGL